MRTVVDWTRIILDSKPPSDVWAEIFSNLLVMAQQESSPVTLQQAIKTPDRFLTEAAWELWQSFPDFAAKTSSALKSWTKQGLNKAVLILDALSLRELHILLHTATSKGIQPTQVNVTGSECPPDTDSFARAIGLSSRSQLTNNKKPSTFELFGGNCDTDCFSIPFEDCPVPSTPNVVIWHSWLDDQIHNQKQQDSIIQLTSKVLQGDSFWKFINKLRQGRDLLITSDHGYAVSRSFTSEVRDPTAVDILRTTFAAKRYAKASSPWAHHFMPPIVMTYKGHHIILGQRKWRVQSGFPQICHGGMSLLEVVVPYVELPAI